MGFWSGSTKGYAKRERNVLMEFNSCDTCIVMCLRTWKAGDTVTGIRNIISFVDYIDHSVLTYPEFETATTKLLAAGAIAVKDSDPVCNDAYHMWWKKKYGKKTVGTSKEIKETKEFLNTTFGEVEPLPKTTGFFSKGEFEAAVKLYLSR